MTPLFKERKNLSEYFVHFSRSSFIMSGQDEEPQKKSFYELLAKRDNALNIQEDLDLLNVKLLDSMASLIDMYVVIEA